MAEPLTKLERRILDYLVDYLRRNTYQPSIREIGRRFDIKSTKTVSEYLQALADKGWIERDPSRSRGVKLLGLDLHPQTVTVPLYAAHAGGDGAGGPGALDELELDRRLAGSTGTFCVVMRGDALEDAGIRSGDLLLVEPVAREELEDGDVAVLRIAGELGVRRCSRRDGAVVLEAARAGQPGTLVQRSAETTVLGRATGVLRRLRQPLAASPASPVAGAEAPR